MCKFYVGVVDSVGMGGTKNVRLAAAAASSSAGKRGSINKDQPEADDDGAATIYYETGIPISRDSLFRLRMTARDLSAESSCHYNGEVVAQTNGSSRAAIDSVRFCVVDEFIEHRSGAPPRMAMKPPGIHNSDESQECVNIADKSEASLILDSSTEYASAEDEDMTGAYDPALSKMPSSELSRRPSSVNITNNNPTNPKPKNCCKHCLLSSSTDPDLMTRIIRELDVIKSLINQNNAIIANASENLKHVKTGGAKQRRSQHDHHHHHQADVEASHVYFGYPLTSRTFSSNKIRSLSLDDLSMGGMFLSRSVDGPRLVDIKLSKRYNGFGAYLAANATTGLGHFILRIEPGSPAHRAGLKEGDFVVEIEGQNVEDIKFFDMIELLKNMSAEKQAIQMLVISYQGYMWFKRQKIRIDDHRLREGRRTNNQIASYASLGRRSRTRDATEDRVSTFKSKSPSSFRTTDDYNSSTIYAVDDCFINFSACPKLCTTACRSVLGRRWNSGNMALEVAEKRRRRSQPIPRNQINYSTYITDGTMI